MRKPRLTWEGAYHHVMNRGINGLDIFEKEKFKHTFYSFISEFSKKYFITIYAFCIMDNHYHLILQNSSGMLSRFMQSLNGSYGMFFRKITGSRGYVYQDRFKSTLIEDDSYLLNSIIYALNNPFRSGVESDPFNYAWSSIHLYFNSCKSSFVDFNYVDNLFQTEENLHSLLKRNKSHYPKIFQTPYGEIFGSENMVLSITNEKDKHFRDIENNRNKGFQTMEKTNLDFEQQYSIKILNIDTNILSGKKLRRQLLKLLRDKSMMKYSEIAELNIFSDVKESSLRNMYFKAKSE